MTEYVHPPFANWSHYDGAIWGVQLCGWMRMLSLLLHHRNNYGNQQTSIEQLLCVTHCPKSFTRIISFSAIL